jgi:predicted CXXCH cytochrome family protein
VVPPRIPARWLPHSRFDHGAHRPVACTECHAAATSTETRDVLLPRVETCRECHLPEGGARSGCVECHRYHDKSQERDPSGPFKVQQLRRNVGSAGPDRLR